MKTSKLIEKNGVYFGIDVGYWPNCDCKRQSPSACPLYFEMHNFFF